MNAVIGRELDRLNEAPMACGESRRAIFEANERTHLQPLPADPWEWGEWLRRKVGPKGHVGVDHYLVPDGRVGRELAVCAEKPEHSGEDRARSRFRRRSTRRG